MEFLENGKEVWPDSIVFIFALHHSLTTVLGVPMIIYYRTNRALHWLCFDLQMAGFMGLALGEYTKLLDVNEPNQLRRFKIANLVALITMIWTRVFHWTYLCVELFVTIERGLSLLSVSFYQWASQCSTSLYVSNHSTKSSSSSFTYLQSTKNFL